jgi:hypothetical protein
MVGYAKRRQFRPASAVRKYTRNYGPLTVHELFPSLTKTFLERHPCRVFSGSYEQMLGCHSRGYGFESRRRRQFFMVERLANPLPFVVSGRLSRSASQRELALLSFICRDQTGRVLLEVSPQPPFSKPWLRPLIMTRWHR